MDLNGHNIPIITPKPEHKDQKLIINFVKNASGNECITMEFDPEIPEVRTPVQGAAVNVANHIIRSFALDKKNDEVEQPVTTPQEADNAEKTTG